jgi:exodeoxyribonuclease VII large subunit
MNSPYFTVSQINEYVRSYLNANRNLNNVYVRGEIINYSKYPNAHYFTLKGDDDSRIAVVFFFEGISSLSAPLKNGDDVIINGQITLYPKGGTYQLIGRSVTLYGLGQKLIELQKLKEKLTKLGIFDEDKKLPLPKYPRNIGLIVGKDSAALADIRENISKRYQLITLYVFPAIVQGDNAPLDIIRAYKSSLKYPLDVLIVARGGGSSDDLWAFNDENLIMTLSTRKIPLISAVGHEIDTTLIDYLADVRVSTPTKAAEVSVPSKEDLIQDIIAMENRITSIITLLVNNYTRQLNLILSRPIFTKDDEIYNRLKERLSKAKVSLNNSFLIQYQELNHNLVLLSNSLKERFNMLYNNINGRVVSLNTHLAALSPISVLDRGYAVISDEEGKILTSINDVDIDETIVTRLKDGQLKSKVKEKTQNE